MVSWDRKVEVRLRRPWIASPRSMDFILCAFGGVAIRKEVGQGSRVKISHK